MSGGLAPAVLMLKADRARASAHALFGLQDVDGACNHAHYAMFDAARAVLLASEAPVQHRIGRADSGLISAFGQHLVINGLVSKELGRQLKRPEEIRLVADYRGASVELDDTREKVAQAETFVLAMRITFFLINLTTPVKNKPKHEGHTHSHSRRHPTRTQGAR